MTNTLWVHGTTAQVQVPTAFPAYQYESDGLHIAANVDEFDWIHIPLSAPMQTDAQQAQLLAVRARVHVQEGGIAEVIVADGGLVVIQKSIDPLVANLDLVLPSPHVVQFGLALSLQIGHRSHGYEDGPVPMGFILTSAAADFDFLPALFAKPDKPPFNQPVNPRV